MLFACTLPVRRSAIVVPPYGCQTPAMLLLTAFPEPFTPGRPCGAYPTPSCGAWPVTLHRTAPRCGPLRRAAAARGGRCGCQGDGVAASGGVGSAQPGRPGGRL